MSPGSSCGEEEEECNTIQFQQALAYFKEYQGWSLRIGEENFKRNYLDKYHEQLHCAQLILDDLTKNMDNLSSHFVSSECVICRRTIGGCICETCMICPVLKIAYARYACRREEMMNTSNILREIIALLQKEYDVYLSKWWYRITLLHKLVELYFASVIVTVIYSN